MYIKWIIKDFINPIPNLYFTVNTEATGVLSVLCTYFDYTP